jgi:uncharacterized protein
MTCYYCRSQTEKISMIDCHGRFVWYELMTTDVAAAKAFYTKVVGWGTKDAFTPPWPHTLFTVGSAFAGGVTRLPEDAREAGATPMWIGYVGVNDVDTTVDRMKRLGGIERVPPTNVLDISRLSIVTDPQKAILAVIQWLRPSQQPPPALTERKRVGWHELLAADPEQAFLFYGELFNWRKAQADRGPFGTYHLFSVGGQTIGGIFTKPPVAGVPHWLYYFNVGDIDAASERVKAGGGRVLGGPVEVSGGNWIARCIDPQGAVFALEGGRRHGTALGYFVSRPNC